MRDRKTNQTKNIPPQDSNIFYQKAFPIQNIECYKNYYDNEMDCHNMMFLYVKFLELKR
jgi:hypothetical protein